MMSLRLAAFASGHLSAASESCLYICLSEHARSRGN